jgi:hypothetical protein
MSNALLVAAACLVILAQYFAIKELRSLMTEDDVVNAVDEIVELVNEEVFSWSRQLGIGEDELRDRVVNEIKSRKETS